MQYQSGYYKDPAAYGQAYDPAKYAQTPQTPQTPYGQAPYGQAPYGQALYGQAPYGQPPYGQASYGQDPYGQDSYGQVDDMQAGPASYASATTESEEDQLSGGSVWLTAMALSITMLLLIGISVTVLEFLGIHERAPFQPEEFDFPELGGGSSNSSPPDPVLIITAPMTPAIPSTASKEAPDNNTETFRNRTTETFRNRTTKPPVTTTAPSGTPSIYDEAIDKQPLVCTMGDKIFTGLQFPSDSLCDYIFFDSLYKGGRNLLTDKETYTNSLDTFLFNHRAYQRTSLGVGFAFEYLATAEKALKVRNPSPLARFWKEDIFHVGILDTPATAVRDQMKAAIATLKAMNRLLGTLRARGNFSITALAMPQPDLWWSLIFAADFTDIGFTPSLIITFGHYRFGDNTVQHCAVMPPTRHPDDTPPDDIARDYKFDLSTAVSSIRALLKASPNTTGLVSVTLKGRWTKPRVPDSVDFFTRCSSDPKIESFGSYTEVCPGGSSGAGARLDYSEKHYAVITYIKSKNRTFVYDDEKAFAAKLCHAKSMAPNVTFGIAVYDIDYDDFADTCRSLNKYNRYSRLRAVKKVVESFRRQKAAFKKDDCVRYAAP